MTPFLKSTLKYFTFFLLGIAVAAFVSFTAFSYFTIDQLSKAFSSSAPLIKNSLTTKPVDTANKLDIESEINPNLKEIILLGTQYMNELDLVDQLNRDMSPGSIQPLCNILCKPIGISRDRYFAERTPLLINYVRSTKEKAWEDPLFRIRVAEMTFLSELFPKSIRDILQEVSKTKEVLRSDLTKMNLALKLQWTLFKEMTNLLFRWERMKKQLHVLQHQRGLLGLCSKGISPKKITEDCNIASH